MSTIGLELEFADVNRRQPIPPEYGRWSEEDYSIVNSDGHANCPTGQTWQWGGEINTRPVNTPEEAAELVERIVEYLDPKPVINWKCNLHVHVRPDDVRTIMRDVERLKRAARWMRDAESAVYALVEMIPRPVLGDFENDREAYQGAMKRYRRRLVSHQHSLSDERFAEMMAASTPEEFRDAHASPTAAGRRAWHIAPRPGMNLRSLWKHGTIEYRHFPGTCDPREIEAAAAWCQMFTEVAFGEQDKTVLEIFNSRTWLFPTFRQYDHKQWLEFERTKHR